MSIVHCFSSRLYGLRHDKTKNKPFRGGIKMNTPEFKLQRLFIVGCPRSGTTWTMSLLAHHPFIVACTHLELFHIAMKRFEEWWEEDSTFNRNIILPASNAAEERANKSRYGSMVPLNHLFSDDEFYSLCTILAENIFDKIGATKPGTKVVVDQTPRNLEVASLILKIFPDAYFLHVIRDPRSVVCSLRSASQHTWGSWAPADVVECTEWWASFVENGRQIGRWTKRYRAVHYEMLHKDGPAELNRIFSWLNLPLDLPVCEEIMQHCTIERFQKHPNAQPGFFRKGSPEGWRDELSPTEVRMIEERTLNLMEALGYARSFEAE
jgi:hypothetical protein